MFLEFKQQIRTQHHPKNPLSLTKSKTFEPHLTYRLAGLDFEFKLQILELIGDLIATNLV
jgi:hypothetical protein